MKCKHYKGEGYSYNISEDENLCLCEQCHLILAGRIAEQVTIEALIKSSEQSED